MNCAPTPQLSSEQEKCAWRKGGIALSALLLRNWIYPFLSSAFWFPRICVLLSGCELAHAMQNNAAASRLVQFPCNEGKIIKTVGEFVMGVFTTGEAAFAQVLDSPKGHIFPPVTRSTALNPIPTRFLQHKETLHATQYSVRLATNLA